MEEAESIPPAISLPYADPATPKPEKTRRIIIVSQLLGSITVLLSILVGLPAALYFFGTVGQSVTKGLQARRMDSAAEAAALQPPHPALSPQAATAVIDYLERLRLSDHVPRKQPTRAQMSAVRQLLMIPGKVFFDSEKPPDQMVGSGPGQLGIEFPPITQSADSVFVGVYDGGPNADYYTFQAYILPDGRISSMVTLTLAQHYRNEASLLRSQSQGNWHVGEVLSVLIMQIALAVFLLSDTRGGKYLWNGNQRHHTVFASLQFLVALIYVFVCAHAVGIEPQNLLTAISRIANQSGPSGPAGPDFTPLVFLFSLLPTPFATLYAASLMFKLPFKPSNNR